MDSKTFTKQYYKCISPTKLSGIYAVYCPINDKIYIGRSISISKRWANHRNMLKRKVHSNPHLQNIYNLYGKSSLTFYVVDFVDLAKLKEMEEFYLSLIDKEYVINLDTVGPLFRASDEHKKKMSEAAKNRSPEAQEKISNAVSKAKKGKPAWNKGLTGIYSEETRKKISISQLGRTSPRKGVKLTVEQKQVISDKIKKKWEDPSYRKAITDSVKRNPHSKDPITGKFIT